eukprot:comp22982_c0_seq1/m.36571 comp22982_c0_seq1/g.36571  ORF comp22982_c0_seq1/g.36571 comp22982_c0_seq1/m.36571 type:complete len:305 (+) comp22982_c0_seq1:1001-1915(+)
MENTQSLSQVMQRLLSLSSKNSRPSCSASRGTYSMMARRTRHCLSSASSTMAGRSACDSSSIPTTLFTASSFEMIFKRTSGNSSFNNCRNRGMSWSMVFCLPRTVDRFMIFFARAARTCWLESTTSSLTAGSTSRMAVSSRTSAGRLRQKSGTCCAAAVLTSASGSLSSLMNAGIRSALEISGPSSSCSWTNLSAAMYRTRQALSASVSLRGPISCASISAGWPFSRRAIVTATSTDRRRTESWSSWARATYRGTSSLFTAASSTTSANPRMVDASLPPGSFHAPSFAAAALLTMGVSSRQRAA